MTSEGLRLCAEDDLLFSNRLREINQEVDTILSKTACQRTLLHDHIMYPYAVEAATRSAAPLMAALDPHKTSASSTFTPAAAAAPMAAASPSPRIDTSVMEAMVKAQCEVEVERWMENKLAALLQPMVEEQAAKHWKRMLDSAQALRTRQDELRMAVDDAMDRWQSNERVMRTELETGTRLTKRLLEESREHTEDRFRQLKSEWAATKDVVAEIRSSVMATEQRCDGRVDHLVRHHNESTRASTAKMQAEFFQWRDDLTHAVRQQVAELLEQQDGVTAHVARLNGALGSCMDSINQNTVDIQHVVEDNLRQRSDVRLCRQDVNRLEMLAQTVGMVRDPLRPRTASEVELGHAASLEELHERVRRMEEMQMDGGPPTHTPRLSSERPSTRRPSSLVEATSAKQSTIFQPQPTSSNASGRYGQPSLNSTTLKPSVAHDDEQQQQPCPAMLERQSSASLHYSNSSAATLERHGSAGAMRPPPQRRPAPEVLVVDSDDDGSPMRVASPMVDSYVSDGPGPGRASLRDDSGSISAMGRQQDSVGADEFPPAPTSDSESERENLHLSRVALD